MKTEIVRYEPSHIEEIMKCNPREREIRFSKMVGWGEWKRIWREGGIGFTLIIDGTVIGCAGIIFVGKDSGEAWAVLSSLIGRYPKTAFVSLRDGMEAIIHVMELKELKAWVEPDFEEAQHLMYHLGFRFYEQGNIGPEGEHMMIFRRKC